MNPALEHRAKNGVATSGRVVQRHRPWPETVDEHVIGVLVLQPAGHKLGVAMRNQRPHVGQRRRRARWRAAAGSTLARAGLSGKLARTNSRS